MLSVAKMIFVFTKWNTNLKISAFHAVRQVTVYTTTKTNAL